MKQKSCRILKDQYCSPKEAMSPILSQFRSLLIFAKYLPTLHLNMFFQSHSKFSKCPHSQKASRTKFRIIGQEIWTELPKMRTLTGDFRNLSVAYCGPGSSVGIATDYGLVGPGSNPGGDEIFRPSRPALGPTQPPVKWVSGLSRGQSAAGACC